MTRSTHIKRVTSLVVIAGALTVLAPVAQAEPILSINERTAPKTTQWQSGYGVDRVSDSVEAARAAQLRDATAMPDVVDRAVVAHQQEIAQQSFPPDVIERTAASGPEQYYFQPSESPGVDWSDFGMGLGAGVGLMVVLGGLGIGVALSRRSHGQVVRA
jgi:hypothetical protein